MDTAQQDGRRKPFEVFRDFAKKVISVREGGDRSAGKALQETASEAEGSMTFAAYQGTFTIRKGEWLEHRLPLKDFVPSFRGRTLTNEPPLTAEQLTSVGFLIVNQQAGPFRLGDSVRYSLELRPRSQQYGPAKQS